MPIYEYQAAEGEKGCKFCADGINMGGKTGVHLLELLFPSR